MDLPEDVDSDSSEESDDYSSLDRSLEVTRSPSQDDLVPLLECPVCFELPLPPIRTCVQGHIICVDCCCKLQRCPLCQLRIDIGRNFFAEDFLNKSVIKCKYKVDGCNTEVPGEKMKAHMHTCTFRPLKCKECGARIAFSEFENHMFRQHGIGRWDLNDQGVRIIESQKQRVRIDHGGIIDFNYASMKNIYASLILTALLTILVDFLYKDSSLSIF